MTDREAADRKANEIIPPGCLLFNEDQPWVRGQISIAIQEAVIAERARLAALVVDVPEPASGMNPRDAQNVALQIYRQAIRAGG